MISESFFEVPQNALDNAQHRSEAHNRVIIIIPMQPHLFTLSTINLIVKTDVKFPEDPQSFSIVYIQKPWSTKKGAEAPFPWRVPAIQRELEGGMRW